MSIQGRRKGFFTEVTRDGHVLVEKETFTCNHCSRVIIVEQGSELGQSGVGEFCLACMQPICCGCNAEMNLTRKCVPLQQKLDRLYARNQLFKSMGI